MAEKKKRPVWLRVFIVIGSVIGILVLIVAFLALGPCRGVPEPDLNYPADATPEAQASFVISAYLYGKGCTPVHNGLAYVESGETGTVVHVGEGIRGRTDTPVGPDDQFKIASITKIFVSTVTLQLMEEGKLSLDDPAAMYLSDIDYLRWDELHVLDGVSHSDEMTIDQLLQHRTGMADIFSDTALRFQASVFEYPHRLYTPETIVERYYQYKLNTKPHFAPDAGYYYSDMNYVLLGLIIEQITGDDLAHQIRVRVLEPLDMQDTYFEYFEDETGSGNHLDSYFGPVNIDANLYTSHDWAGGGHVSTTGDLATYVQALFAGELYQNDDTLDLMIDNSANQANDATYARGVSYYEIDGRTYLGHGGFYGSLMLYDPEDEVTLVAHLGQSIMPYSRAQIENLVITLIEIVSQ